LFFDFSVLSHHYGGNDGARINKISTTSIVLDFELFQTLATKEFIENIFLNVDTFVNKLKQHQQEGTFIYKKQINFCCP